HRRVPVLQEERLLVRDVQRRPFARHQPMPADGGCEAVACVVGPEDKQTTLRAPIPLVGPVAGALLVGRPRARRSWGFGRLAPRSDDGIALWFGNRRRQLLMRAAAADEEREARRAEHVTHPRRAQTAALRGIVGARLEPERQAVGEEDPVAQPTVRDRKSTRLNSSHQIISYAVFCLKK